MSGDALNVEDLFRRHRRMVLRRIRRFVGPDEAQDLLQQSFERALRHAGSYDGRGSAVGWLYRIATRECLHHLRDTGRRTRLLETWGTPAWSRPAPAPDPESRTFLEQAWRQLDASLAEIGTYHFVDGLTQAEIAEVLGCSRRTVGNRLTHLRDRIRQAADPVEAS